MPDNDTLLAYLVPKLNRQVENAATDGLGYILNKSTRCMEALNNLLQASGLDVAPVVRVDTQVSYEDGSRPDMVGYDDGNIKRLLVEAKFWAPLLEGQASGYAQQFDHPGPAVLMFICPEVRTPTIWNEIWRQMKSNLESLDSPTGVLWAKVSGTQRHLMLISWIRLLDSMSALAGNAGVESDIRQLRGLALSQDTSAFLPLHADELGPESVRRMNSFWRVAEAAINKGSDQGLIKIGSSGQWFGGRGRYLILDGISGWFGVDSYRWAKNGDTPLWLYVYDVTPAALPQTLRDKLRLVVPANSYEIYVPVYPKTNADETAVVDDILSQLRTIADAINAAADG